MGADQSRNRERTMTRKPRTAPAMHIVTVLSVCLCAVSAETIPVKETRTSTVRIVPVHVLGNELGGNVDVDLFQSKDEKTNFAKRFHSGSASGIPYGTYTTRVYVRGFFPAERVVRVFQPNVVVVIGLQIGMEGGPPTSNVSGRIRGADQSAGAIRVRISGVYSNDTLDAEVNGLGGFSLEKVPQGEYVLAVTQRERVLVVKAIKLSSAESPIVIEVDDSKPITSKADGKSNQ
jgi:hypothetical protein